MTLHTAFCLRTGALQTQRRSSPTQTEAHSALSEDHASSSKRQGARRCCCPPLSPISRFTPPRPIPWGARGGVRGRTGSVQVNKASRDERLMSLWWWPHWVTMAMKMLLRLLASNGMHFDWGILCGCWGVMPQFTPAYPSPPLLSLVFDHIPCLDGSTITRKCPLISEGHSRATYLLSPHPLRIEGIQAFIRDF